MYDEFARSIFSELNSFLAITVGSNLHGASNFLNLLGPLEKYGKKIRKDANKSLQTRMIILSKAIETRYPGSNIISVLGSPTMFVQINDSRINLPTVTAADVIFDDTNVNTVPGSPYGSDDTYVRVNIMAYSEDLTIFANRLLNKKKYQPKDLIVSSYRITPAKIICNKKYVVNPNDRKLHIDANNGKVTVYLHEFLGYESPMKLHIKRIDGECNKVKVKSKYFTIKLKICGSVLLRWSQPFYQNGSWEIIKLHHGKDNHHKLNIQTIQPQNIQTISRLYLV